MANKQHVLMILRSVKEWNIWRAANPELVPDLSEADLKGADLRRADLGEVNLRGADLRNADLGGANFRLEDLNEADHRGAYW